MRTPPNSPATFAGRGLLLRAANGPFGRALIGVALGLALAGAQQGGWFRQADFSALDAANALVHPLWEPAPVVVVAGPSQAADATLRAAALQATLDAGASAVGFDETFLHPRDAASPKEGGALLALATDPRCVVARTRPNASGGPGAVRPRLATVERFVQDGGRARSVTPRLSWSGPETAGGFVYQTTVRAAAGYPRTGGAWRRIQRALAALESRDGMLIDYALRPPPLQATTLEAIASAPLPALRERVHGRVVLLSGTPWGRPTWLEGRADEAAPSAAEPALAWAIASALSGSGSTELAGELTTSALVLLALVLMLTMGDRGLGGKAKAGGVALAGLAGLTLGGLLWWRTFVPPCSLATGVVLAFLVSVCLELAEAGMLIAEETRAQPDAAPWGETRRPGSASAAVEDTLRSLIEWHGLTGAGLLLRDAGTPSGLVTVSGSGEAEWGGSRGLQALGDEALLADAPAIGDWPSGPGKAVALPVVLAPGRGAALLLQIEHLPAPRAVVDFGTRVVRQLLATRAPGSSASPTLARADARPHKLPLPLQVARLRATQTAQQEQTAVAAAWRAGPHEAVVIFDTAGRPVVWNRRAETLFGDPGRVELGEAHIVPLLARALETREAEVREAAMGVLLDGLPYICELEDPAGRYNYVASLARVGADPLAPAGLALRGIDVTGVCRPARVEARLMSVAAHEMRTPLTSVMGYAELLAGLTEEGSKARQHAETIRRQAERMEAVVAELLTVTRLEAGREELVVEPVDMGAIARQVAAGLQPLAEAGGIHLAVRADGHCEVRGDVPKLERVVENLVTNAIKYSPEGAAVTVAARREGEAVVVEVRDSGHGIPAEDAPHVFEKFYRAKCRRTEHVQGTGLGLAIVRLIVEAHGGSVSLRTVEGQGSTFTVALPVQGPPERTVSDPAA